MSHFVYSTLASDVKYTNHEAGGADLPRPVFEVLIRGGAGVANDRLITPLGVVTEITDQQLEQLQQNPVFQIHRNNGFVTVQSRSVDIEKVVADMTGRDNSAPLIEADIGKEAKANVSPDGGDEASAPKGKKSR